MFDFRIIDTEDGNQVIRNDLKTPYSALTPEQYIEYTNMEVQLYIADRQKKKFLKEIEKSNLVKCQEENKKDFLEKG